jgi:hypothetical protein
MASHYPGTRAVGLGHFHRDRSGPRADASRRDGPLDCCSLLLRIGHLLLNAMGELGLGDPGQGGGAACSLSLGHIPIEHILDHCKSRAVSRCCAGLRRPAVPDQPLLEMRLPASLPPVVGAPSHVMRWTSFHAVLTRSNGATRVSCTTSGMSTLPARHS